MINLSVVLYMPRTNIWRGLRTKSVKLTRNYHLLFNTYKTNHIASIDLSIRLSGDHIGSSIQLGIAGFNVEIELYNINHAKD